MAASDYSSYGARPIVTTVRDISAPEFIKARFLGRLSAVIAETTHVPASSDVCAHKLLLSIYPRRHMPHT